MDAQAPRYVLFHALIPVLSIAIALCNILGRIHAGNIIHKDINPGNIVLLYQTIQKRLHKGNQVATQNSKSK
ncbi:MAG: hypothetical protein V7L21_20915 [Nostoc sp.]|uniref:hypothetical protein n=1 Tax=unclassified Nostoc TaxID=2593658 RepID=UPI0025F21996|nr:hypothetical protein [Nostoc sp. NMS9]MBN3944418.1 hypothetical protein [Nostoc sp. NMS9]